MGISPATVSFPATWGSRRLPFRFQQRAEERFAEVALGREVAGQHHPRRARFPLTQVDQNLAPGRDDHRAERVGADRVEQLVALLVATVLERREPGRQALADSLLDVLGDEPGLARLLEVVDRKSTRLNSSHLVIS